MYQVVTTQSLSFLIGSSSFLQVRRTTIKAWMSSNFGQIQPRTAELAALERLKITIDLQWEKCCEHYSAFIFECFFIVLASNKDTLKSLSELEFRLHPTTDYEVSWPLRV